MRDASPDGQTTTVTTLGDAEPAVYYAGGSRDHGVRVVGADFAAAFGHNASPSEMHDMTSHEFRLPRRRVTSSDDESLDSSIAARLERSSIESGGNWVADSSVPGSSGVDSGPDSGPEPDSVADSGADSGAECSSESSGSLGPGSSPTRAARDGSLAGSLPDVVLTPSTAQVLASSADADASDGGTARQSAPRRLRSGGRKPRLQHSPQPPPKRDPSSLYPSAARLHPSPAANQSRTPLHWHGPPQKSDPSKVPMQRRP